jgi:hypothetical protein
VFWPFLFFFYPRSRLAVVASLQSFGLGAPAMVAWVWNALI